MENTPVSEATRGVIAVLNAFQLPTDHSDLAEARSFFEAQSIESHVQQVLEMAGVSTVVMTNDPLDPVEAAVWLNGVARHRQFRAVLRLDRILCTWSTHWQVLASQGYKVDEHASGKVRSGSAPVLDGLAQAHASRVHGGLAAGHFRISARHGWESIAEGIGASRLPRTRYTALADDRCPQTGQSGAALGRRRRGPIELRALENLCREFPDNRFLVSVLSRENQHELCVYARKFSNLMPFGCWWFMNNPSIVEEITRERIEMLGTSFIPQHSDARVLEQVIYKWNNTRRTMARILPRVLSSSVAGRPRRNAQRHSARRHAPLSYERRILDGPAVVRLRSAWRK